MIFNRTLVYIFIAVIFKSTALFAQERKLLNEFQTLFFDVQTGEPVIIINDSLILRGYDFKPHLFTGLETENDLWLRYVYSNEKATLVVGKSCGPVYNLKDNHFKRIDNSFPHRNQYGAGHFLHDNTPHLFGGYGMFTFKNIITKFNFNTGEWQEVKVNSKIKPEPRREFLYHQNDSLFFIINGLKKDPENPSKEIKIEDQRLWKLDLNKMKWVDAGIIKHSLNGYLNYLSFTKDGKWYLVGSDILEIDIENNSFKRYKLREWRRIHQLIFDHNTQLVTYIYKATSSNEFYAQTLHFDDFVGELEIEDVLFKSNLKGYVITGSMFIFVLLIFYLIKTKKLTIQSFNGIVYNPDENRFYYKKQPIVNLEENEHKLLQFLTHKKETYTLLNDLNHLFNGNDSDSYATISKRRELTQAQMLLKISVLLNIPKNKIVMERKNPNDNRIKEIKLAQGIVKIKN